MTQDEIIGIIGESSTTENLANLLNDVDKSDNKEKWHGVIVSVKYLEKIIAKTAFGAVLREGNPLGHLVLVEKLQDNMLYIKDPWDGTSYQMMIGDFLEVWNGEIIFRWNLSQ